MLAEDDGTTIQRGTDIRFLHALAARNGYDCYVQPSVVPGTDEGHFEPRALTGTPDAVINVGFGDRTNVVGFSIRDDLDAAGGGGGHRGRHANARAAAGRAGGDEPAAARPLRDARA